MTRKQTLAFDFITLSISLSYMLHYEIKAALYLAILAIMMSLLNTYHYANNIYKMIGVSVLQVLLIAFSNLHIYPYIYILVIANSLFCMSFMDYYQTSITRIQRQLDSLMNYLNIIFILFLFLYVMIMTLFPIESTLSLLASILLIFGPLTLTYCFSEKIS